MEEEGKAKDMEEEGDGDGDDESGGDESDGYEGKAQTKDDMLISLTHR